MTISSLHCKFFSIFKRLLTRFYAFVNSTMLTNKAMQILAWFGLPVIRLNQSGCIGVFPNELAINQIQPTASQIRVIVPHRLSIEVKTQAQFVRFMCLEKIKD